MAALPLRAAPRFVAVDREGFTLRVYALRLTRYRRIRQIPIAVGALGFETPAGPHFVAAKAKDPAWLPPDSDWVGPELRGPDGKPRMVPPGDPRNPLRGAFLSLVGSPELGVGIHGTAAEDSLGTRASHGCIRVRADAALDLYRHVPVGTPVFVY